MSKRVGLQTTIIVAMLSMIGPFTIDSVFPAFARIGVQFGASDAALQQITSIYLFSYAFASLFHGPISDSVGRKPVMVAGMAAFTLASIGCALAPSLAVLLVFRAVQGIFAGAAQIISRALVRDLYDGWQAQRVMAQVSMIFGIAPALAPVIGGLLSEALGWHAVFWFLVAVGVVLTLVNLRFLPETLPVQARQPFQVGNLMRGYGQLLSDPRFLLLALASGVPFNGMFLYVLSAPAFLGDILALRPTQFFWFFVLTISGIMLGSWQSGRMAGKVRPKNQIMRGFRIMLGVSLLNVVANLLFTPSVWWSLWPIAIFSYGWALMVPVVTLMVLDLHPARRGMASSLQAVVASTANGIVAGVVAPLVMHSAIGMALTSLALMAIGLVAWGWLRMRWRDMGY